MKWVDNFRGRKARKEKETEAKILSEARRIATGSVGEIVTYDKRMRRAFKGIMTRHQASILGEIGAKNHARELARQTAEDERYGTSVSQPPLS